jgi:ATP synthase protein I
MAENKRPGKSEKNMEQWSKEVEAKQDRKLKKLAEKDRGLWFGLGMFGLIGWAVAIPTLMGTAAGLWLDKVYPQGFSWTLSLLFLGVVIGCLNAWLWVKRESGHD